MSLWQRARSALAGVASILFAFAVLTDPKDGFAAVATVIGFSLIVYGLRHLVFYCTMARHMVGGKVQLCVGIIALDLGSLVIPLTSGHAFHIALYLVGCHAVSGVVGILRGLEERRLGSPWKMTMTRGVGEMLATLACVVCLCLGMTRMLATLYAAGLVYSGAMRIAATFRKSDIVYVQ